MVQLYKKIVLVAFSIFLLGAGMALGAETKAKRIRITDPKDYYASTNVEGALEEAREYVDLAVSSLELTEYYSNADLTPDVGDYKSMDTELAAASTLVSDDIDGTVGTPTSLFTFLTPANSPHLDRFLIGDYSSHTHLLKGNLTGNLVTKFYYEIWRINAAGADIALLEASDVISSDFITISNAPYDIHAHEDTETSFDTTDRIAIKWYGYEFSGSGTMTITMTVGDASDSHFSLLVQGSELSSIFVPYTGAEDDVDLGTHNFTTAGTGGVGTSFSIAGDATALYLAKGSSSGDYDVTVYFGDDGNDTAHFLRWDDGASRFVFSANLYAERLEVHHELRITHAGILANASSSYHSEFVFDFDGPLLMYDDQPTSLNIIGDLISLGTNTGTTGAAGVYTGSGTDFVADGIQAGDIFQLKEQSDEGTYIIKSVEDGTHLTIDGTFANQPETSQSHRVYRGTAFSQSLGMLLERGEQIYQTVDGSIDFVGRGGTDDTDLRIDLDGTYPVISSPTDGIVGFLGILEGATITESGNAVPNETEVPGMTSTTPKIIMAFTLYTVADDMDDFGPQFPRAMTITKVTMKCENGTNVVGRLYEVDGDGDSSDKVGIETGDWTVTTTETEDSSFNNATLDAGDYLRWFTTSHSGEVIIFNVTVEGYET